MPERISENQLILPALWLLNEAGEAGVNTSELIIALRALLRPTGEDLEILDNRNDDKFSQKVRNLKSHKTLEAQGVAKYQNGIWQITEQGKDFLSAYEPALEYLITGEFEYRDLQDALESISYPQEKGKPLLLFREGASDESLEISEGI